MEEQLVSFEIAKLAKEKGFRYWCQKRYSYREEKYGELENSPFKSVLVKPDPKQIFAPTQSILQKFIRENRGVHIEINRNASGWFWSMSKENGGTDLGCMESSEIKTDCESSGTWSSFEKCLENACYVQLLYDLPKDTSIIKHWGNYCYFAINEYNKNIK